MKIRVLGIGLLLCTGMILLANQAVVADGTNAGRAAGANAPNVPTIAQVARAGEFGEGEALRGTPLPAAERVIADERPAWSYPTPPRLVNREHRLPETYLPELVRVGDTYFEATPDTCAAILELMDAAKNEGIRGLHIRSGYRSYETQDELHTEKVRKFRSRYGDEAEAMASTVIQPAGASEHQLGEAIDLTTTELVASFGETEAGCWLSENAHLFGFILRYPKGTESITGVIYEPWHIRYVGIETAQVLYDLGITLEEYIALYEKTVE